MRVSIYKTKVLDRCEGLLEIRDDISWIFNAYRQADKAWSHTRGALLIGLFITRNKKEKHPHHVTQ